MELAFASTRPIPPPPNSIQRKRRFIMDKLVVVVFPNENRAYDGLWALEDLNNEGSIQLYAKALITRGADGKVIVKQKEDNALVGTGVGVLIGMLVGAFIGPLGVIVGANAGALGGLTLDFMHAEIDQDYLDEIGQSLKPGKAAVVAELSEDWTPLVNSRMEELGGVVFRRTRRDMLDVKVEFDITTLKAEMDELKSGYDRTDDSAKVKLQAQMEQARAKLQARVVDIQARLEAGQQETAAKIQSLQEQARQVRLEHKVKIEKRIAELRAQQKRRSRLLHRAGELIKEATRG